jgi:hypothetical protein
MVRGEKFATRKKDRHFKSAEIFPPSQEHLVTSTSLSLRTMSLNGLFAIRKPKGISSAAVLNFIQPLFRSSKHFEDHLVSRDSPGHRTKRRKRAEKRVKVPPPTKAVLTVDGPWRDP